VQSGLVAALRLRRTYILNGSRIAFAVFALCSSPWP
jgi:hypothetical protein